MSASETRLPCSIQTREEVLRPLLRDGEPWDSLMRKMAAQYDPEKARDENGGIQRNHR